MAILALPACAPVGDVARSGSQPPTAAGAEGADGVKDWTNVIGGLSVSDSDLQSQAPFEAVLPKGLGRIYLLDTEAEAPRQSVVEFDYDVPGIGRVVVEEAFPEVDAKEWPAYVELLVAQNGSELLQGTAVQVSVRGGKLALMTVSGDGKRCDIRWLEYEQLEVYVRGPSLDPGDCVALAEAV